MHSTLQFRRILPLSLPVFALAAGLSLGGPAWLLTIPAMFVLGRSYGQSHAQAPSNDTTYGVGAALAGFKPENRS